MKKVLVTTLLTALLAGCGMTQGENKQGQSTLSYNNIELLTEEQAKTMPREQRMGRIISDMQEVGFEQIFVSTVIDSASNSILGVYENQFALVSEYKTIVDNHKDVMSFTQANKDKSDAELAAEIKRFDSMAKSPDQKISPKIASYEQANERIQAANIELAKKIAKEAANLAIVFADNSNTMLGLEGVSMLLNAGKIDDAYNLADVRIHLASIANDFITDEKATLEVVKKIQDIADK